MAMRTDVEEDSWLTNNAHRLEIGEDEEKKLRCNTNTITIHHQDPSHYAFQSPSFWEVFKIDLTLGLSLIHSSC